MWTRAETVLAVGLVTVVIGGALSPFVLIGLLGCLLLLIGLAAVATGAVIARNRTISVGRGVSGVLLLWTAAIGLIITTFGLCEIALDMPEQALQILPAVFGLSDWLMYLAAILILAGMFACGLRVAAKVQAARCAWWGLAILAVGPAAAMIAYLLSIWPGFPVTAFVPVAQVRSICA